MGVIRSTKRFTGVHQGSTREETSSESLNEASLKCTMDAPLKFVEEMFFETTKKASVIFMKKGSPNYTKQGKERVKHSIDLGYFKEYEKSIDVPTFCFKSIRAATNNFSQENMVGQGGFGAVYKGKFSGSQELAIKRLSTNSVQGLREFNNEIVLVPKFQHRNLVRLLGYCSEGNEKILLYEYVSNGSLDSFIFDQTRSMYFDWETRFNIIFGIARGLLYLHQDSRLRIIHRDLKPNNILLDEDMNPKIGDFGLAEIIGGKETEGTTDRIAGTCGYMAPEYAMNGVFSVKSDAFSFGVVVLEIISGKKNNSIFHYQSEQSSGFLGYAWKLWREGEALELMDQTLCNSFNLNEFLRCVKVGLLCVQEDPSDRPTMSNVIFMLGSEAATLPSPKQPAYSLRWSPTPSTASSSSKPGTINELTNSMEEGR